jgi:hypothetical protein
MWHGEVQLSQYRGGHFVETRSNCAMVGLSKHMYIAFLLKISG